MKRILLFFVLISIAYSAKSDRPIWGRDTVQVDSVKSAELEFILHVLQVQVSALLHFRM